MQLTLTVAPLLGFGTQPPLPEKAARLDAEANALSAAQNDNDGALQAWKVWSLKLNANLIVLSACETGAGAKVTGEGLIGLTRAWQYAGARTVVSSLWKVRDASTATLMTAFHAYVLAGRDKDEALRLAMRDTATSKQGAWTDPHFWAAFVLVGDTGKLRR